jgi:nucleotide-binding universal stress UspA family protein
MARRRIVIGYNGTPQGEDALALGGLLAKALDADASVAVVAHLPRKAGGNGSLSELSGPLFSEARERLEGTEVHEHPIEEQSAARGLYELAEELKPSAVVVGSARHGGLGSIVLGGVGSSLLAGAPASIAVAPLGYADEGRQLKTIGAAVDGSAQSLRALEAGVELAERAGADLKLLTVAAPHHYLLGGSLSPYSPEEYEDMKEKEDEEVLEEAKARVSSKVSTETALLHGDPADVLPAEASGVDLLVVGSRAYGPLKGALLGSVSAKLMASSPAPVLVVPQGTGPDPLRTD